MRAMHVTWLKNTPRQVSRPPNTPIDLEKQVISGLGLVSASWENERGDMWESGTSPTMISPTSKRCGVNIRSSSWTDQAPTRPGNSPRPRTLITAPLQAEELEGLPSSQRCSVLKSLQNLATDRGR